MYYVLRYFNLGILLTRKCNQCCYYCNNYNINSNFTEIDIDYLNWILETYASIVSKIHVELSGGEPGLISNLNQAFQLLMEKPYVYRVTVLSNGTIRKLNYDLENVLEDKFYNYIEHFCLEIEDRNIKFFYPELPFYENLESWVNFVLVLSDITLDSLLNNLDYFTPLYSLPIKWKAITPKTAYPTDEYLNKLNTFYNYLLHIQPICNTDVYLFKNGKLDILPSLHKTCAKISPYQFIDLENKRIGLCSMQTQQSPTYEITKENITKALDGSLFSANVFCEKCYKYNRNCLINMYNRKFFKKYEN